MPVEQAPGADRAASRTSRRSVAWWPGWRPGSSSRADDTPRGRRAGRTRSSRAGRRPGSRPRRLRCLNFTRGRQPLVDAAFLAHAIARAPHALWSALDADGAAAGGDRARGDAPITPGFNNWLLFSAMVEAALCRVGEPWDQVRVDYALRQHEPWYKGDGVYGDGPAFHWDYYNSFVIQPDAARRPRASAATRARAGARFVSPRSQRARRYAAIHERLVAPDGSFPPVGRSLAYRCGAFQLLAQMGLRRQLPDGVSPAQVRGALDAVIRRTLDAPETFDANGWLRIGLCGHQPGSANATSRPAASTLRGGVSAAGPAAGRSVLVVTIAAVDVGQGLDWTAVSD